MYKVAFKYWLFHGRELFSIILTIAVSMASILACTFLVRGMSVKQYEGLLDAYGSYDYIFLNIDDKDYERIEASNLFEKGGILKIYGEVDSVSEKTYTAGSLDKSGEELYHYSCKEGRYPQDAKEITATKECLEALGIEPVLGAKAHLKINCEAGDTYEDDFIVSGILCEPKQERYIFEYPEIVLPQIFFYDLDAQGIRYFLGLEKIGYVTDDIYLFADENNLACVSVPGYKGVQSMFLPTEGEMTRENQERLMEYIQKDFNSAVLVPVFSIIIALLSGISIYAALSSTFHKRKKSLDMIRCIGLTKRKMLVQIAVETCLLSGMGLLLGYGLGILWYAGTLLVQKELFGLRIYSAFQAPEIICRATLDPYTYPLVICLEGIICICVLLLIHMYATTDKFVFFTRQESPVRCKAKRRKRAGEEKRILHRCFAGSISSRFFLSVLMVCLIGVGSFCCLYFAECYQDEVESVLSDEEVNDADFDYAAYKDFSKSNRVTYYANRHHGGITPENIKRLEESPGITKIRYALESKSTKILLKEGTEDKELQNFLKESEIKSSEEYLGELTQKTEEYFGYDGYRCYKIPTVGLSRTQLEDLEPFVVSGAINWEELKAGREVILVLYGEEYCPIQVGDRLQMSDVVQESEEYEKFDFSQGAMPETAKPAFTWHYLDENGSPEKEEWDGYAFGKSVDYEVRIGAVMQIDKDSEEGFYCTETGIYENNVMQFISSMEAFAAWGLKDRNITKVELSLDNPAKRQEFSKLWYEILGSSVDMSGTSSIAREEKKKNLFMDYSSIIVAIVVVLLLCSALGCYHLIQRELLYKEETLRKLGELGMTGKSIRIQALKENLKYPLIGVCIGWLPVAVFDWIGDMISRKFEGGISYSGKKPWYAIYPLSNQLLNKSTALVFFLAFAITCLLTAYVVLRTLRGILKKK